MPPIVTKQVANAPKKSIEPAGKPRILGPRRERTPTRQLRSAWDFLSGYKFLIYGEGGTGKTTLWSSFPGPISVAVCSGGSHPGELKSLKTAAMKAKIDPRIVECRADLDWMIDQAETGKVGSFILDHATGFEDLILREVLGVEELPPQRDWGMATQATWGEVSGIMKAIFKRILNLPCHAAIVGQQREFKVEGGSDLVTPCIGVALTPSTAGWLNPACDYVVQTLKQAEVVRTTVVQGGKRVTKERRTGKIQFALRTGPHDVYMTKFRLPMGRTVPQFVVNPTFAKLVAIIEGED